MRKVLENVPKVGWGRNIECTFFGCLDTAFRFIGEETDYTFLMGVSAAAFRLRFHQPEWCASSPDAALDGTYPELATKAMGYKGEFVIRMIPGQRAIDKMLRMIKEEIDAGRPLLAIGLTRIPDWGLIVGYDENNLLCRTYHDKTDEYSAAEGFPWILFRMRKRDEEKPKIVDSIVNSLKVAVEIARIERIDHYANGLAAYDAWIKDLENEAMFANMKKEEFKAYWRINGWIYDSLYDARLAASKYLQRVSEEFTGKTRENLQRTSEKFEEIAQALFDNWAYFTMPHWVKEGKTWTPKETVGTDTWTEDMRKKGAEALKKIRTLEENALKLLEKTVKNI